MARIEGKFDFRSRTILAVVFLLLSISIPGCRDSAETNLLPLDSSDPITVNGFKPSRIEGAIKTVTYYGTVEPNRRITTGFSVGGKLLSVAQQQQRFPVNSVLAELDRSALIQERSQIQSQLTQLAESNPADTATLQQLQQRIGDLDASMEQRVLTAPFDCIVERSLESANSLVGPNSPLLVLVETANPKIRINLPRRISRMIDPEGDYFFLMDGTPLQGTLRERAFTEDPPGGNTVWFNVESDLTNVEFSLGQSVEAKLSFQTDDNGYWLPLSALRNNSNGLWTVFIARAEEGSGDQQTRIEPLVVEVIRAGEDAALVSGDLENRIVVRDGLHRIVPGQLVQVNLWEPVETADPNLESEAVPESETETNPEPVSDAEFNGDAEPTVAQPSDQNNAIEGGRE